MSRNRLKIAIGPKAHEQHQFRIGGTIRGEAAPVPDSETEWTEYYKVSRLKLIERTQPNMPPESNRRRCPTARAVP